MHLYSHTICSSRCSDFSSNANASLCIKSCLPCLFKNSSTKTVSIFSYIMISACIGSNISTKTHALIFPSMSPKHNLFHKFLCYHLSPSSPFQQNSSNDFSTQFQIIFLQRTSKHSQLVYYNTLTYQILFNQV